MKLHWSQNSPTSEHQARINWQLPQSRHERPGKTSECFQLTFTPGGSRMLPYGFDHTIHRREEPPLLSLRAARQILLTKLHNPEYVERVDAGINGLSVFLRVPCILYVRLTLTKLIKADISIKCRLKLGKCLPISYSVREPEHLKIQMPKGENSCSKSIDYVQRKKKPLRDTKPLLRPLKHS